MGFNPFSYVTAPFKGAYGMLYGNAADEQKQGLDRAAGQARDLGSRMSDFYEGARQRSQGYYDRADAYANNTNGPDYLGDLYRRNAGSAGPMQNRQRYADDLNTYNSRKTAAQNAYGDVDYYYSQPSKLDSYADEMRGYGYGSSNSQKNYDRLTGTKMPTYAQDRYKSRLETGIGDASKRTDSALAEARGMGGSAAAGLRFDPTQTQAIGSLYNDYLKPQETQNGYLEQFYEDTANGTNPYYDRLRQQTSKAAQRRAAAGGAYNAGASQRQEAEALTDLSAKEFSERGQLAGAAQAAKQGRFNDLTGQAKTYEDTVAENRRFNLDVARAQDAQTNSRMGFISSLSQAGDRNYLDAQGQLDALAGRSGEEYLGQQRLLSDSANIADQAESRRRSDYQDYLKGQDASAMAKNDARMRNAFALDDQDFQRRKQLAAEADASSREEFGQQDYLTGLAKGASGEQQTREDAKMRNLLATAAARVGIDWNHVQAAGGAISDAEWAAIEAELKKSGIDAATMAAMRNDLLKTAELGRPKAA